MLLVVDNLKAKLIQPTKNNKKLKKGQIEKKSYYKLPSDSICQ
jgi:hypothetical protein